MRQNRSSAGPAYGVTPAGFFCGGTEGVGSLSKGHDDVQLDQIDQIVI
jgi:hypothetical protein